MGQVLIDSIGPRLSGSPGFASAVTWLETHVQPASASRRASERYGTWRGWQQGAVHMQLDRAAHAESRCRTAGVEPGHARREAGRGDVVVIPALADAAAATQWLKTVKGKFVLMSRAGSHVSRAAGTRTLRARDARSRDSMRSAPRRVACRQSD